MKPAVAYPLGVAGVILAQVTQAVDLRTIPGWVWLILAAIVYLIETRLPSMIRSQMPCKGRCIPWDGNDRRGNPTSPKSHIRSTAEKTAAMVGAFLVCLALAFLCLVSCAGAQYDQCTFNATTNVGQQVTATTCTDHNGQIYRVEPINTSAVDIE